jgi:hypothetical protein
MNMTVRKKREARPAKTPAGTSTTQLPRLIREGICRVNADLDAEPLIATTMPGALIRTDGRP